MVCRAIRASLLALLLVVAFAPAAGAHPALNPSEIAAGEPVAATLVVPHGCNPAGGMPDGASASPTTEFAVRPPADVTLAPQEVAGWSIEVSDAEAVVTWRDDGGATTEPIELPVTITATGAVGDVRYLEAFQACEQGEFRWIGTPDREAEWPAVKLTIASTTSRPADTIPVDTGHEANTADETSNDVPADEGPAAGRGGALAQEDAPPPPPGSEEGGGPLLWVLSGVVLVGGAMVGALLLRRARTDAEGRP